MGPLQKLPFPDKELAQQVFPLGEFDLELFQGVLLVKVDLFEFLLYRADIFAGDQSPPFIISRCPSWERRKSIKRSELWGLGALVRDENSFAKRTAAGRRQNRPLGPVGKTRRRGRDPIWFLPALS